MSQTFTAFCRTSFTTRRGGAVDLSTGKSGAETTPITNGRCTRIIPVSDTNALIPLLKTQTFGRMLECHTNGGQDIVENKDALIADGVEYAIRLVQKIPFGATETRLRLVLEQVQR